MQERVQDIKSFTFQPPESTYMLATVRLKAPQPRRNFTFGIDSTVPPATDSNTVMQRGDEVTAVLRMLTDLQTSTILLTGDPGVGKSTLAALLYRRLVLTAQAGLPAPKHFVWLTFGAHTTLPDAIAAILAAININEPGFFLVKPTQQISTLLRALRRPQEPAFVVLDQFETLFHPETQQVLEGRGAIVDFLEMLQQDLGVSRILLTCSRSPYTAQPPQETRVRSFLVSRISLPEGVALVQQRGIQGAYEELSLVWQRCGGHVMALVIFSALVKLSGLSLSYLLNSPDYQPLWSGTSSNDAHHLIATVCNYFNPIQKALVSVLSLFREPVPAEGLFGAITGEDSSTDLSMYEQELELLTRYSLVQRAVNKQDVSCYLLHPLFRHYILDHYLEVSQPHSNGNGSTSPDNFFINSGSVKKPDLQPQEVQEVALAAGYVRVAAYYQDMAQQHYIPREKRSSPQDIVYLLETIRHQCLGWHWQQACDLLISEGIYESMVQWGAWNALIVLYMTMLPPHSVLTRRDEGLICNHLGLLYDRLGDYQRSRAYYERALVVQRQVGDQHGEAITLTNQGELFRGQNALQLARATFEQARALNKQLRDPLLESVLLHNLGILHHTVKDFKQAFNYYVDALRFAQTLEEHYNEGMILTNIGMLFYEQGYHAEALAVLFYTLQMRASLQYSTVSFIELFLTTLEDGMDVDAFARLRQASREVEEQLLSRLISPNMRQ
jgi:tetratricopeptide (TPR) repeat protein